MLTLALAGCDQSFEPIQSSDRHFSIFGFLDASADTQWIRVAPLRDLLASSPDPIGARVTLEQLGTGKTIALRDSAATYRANNLDLGVTRYAHHFWTTESIETGATYRLVAEGAGGAITNAVVPIPDDFGPVTV